MKVQEELDILNKPCAISRSPVAYLYGPCSKVSSWPEAAAPWSKSPLVIAEVRRVQGFWLLAGENGTFKPQMRNSDTETSSETIATRKMKPAVKGVGMKRSSQSKKHVGFRHL